MSFRNSDTGWGWLARLLHWGIAGLILFLLGLGVYMTEIVTDVYAQFALVQTHKSWGFTVFILALIRVIWRFMSRAPDLPDHMGSLERVCAQCGHMALYILMFALPISGWLMASSSEMQEMYSIKNMVFGLFEMPDPFPTGDKGLSDLFKLIHKYCAIALGLILLGHAGAALKHHFVDRDNVLRRMIIGR